jgi:TetR/AcrR family transcriptional regulator of autoinduction and epiphytic fitness
MAIASGVDGRVQRGARNRDAIADAMLVLLEEGDPKPTARAVANRAGVSLRSVFQHFEDMESLYAMCVARQTERLAPLRTPIDASLPRDARMEALVAQRGRLYERIAPVRRAAVLVAPSSSVLQGALTEIAAEHRRELAALFASDLPAPTRREQLAALEVATCFDTWDHLRRVQGMSAGATSRVVLRLACTSLDQGDIA